MFFHGGGGGRLGEEGDWGEGVGVDAGGVSVGGVMSVVRRWAVDEWG